MSALAPAETSARLLIAVLFGALIGINRDLHGKPAGLRTHSLVALGAALAVLASARLAGSGDHQADVVSRVAQGVLTGVGFLGAGGILRDPGDGRVHGLTTAAPASPSPRRLARRRALPRRSPPSRARALGGGHRVRPLPRRGRLHGAASAGVLGRDGRPSLGASHRYRGPTPRRRSASEAREGAGGRSLPQPRGVRPRCRRLREDRDGVRGVPVGRLLPPSPADRTGTRGFRGCGPQGAGPRPRPRRAPPAPPPVGARP